MINPVFSVYDNLTTLPPPSLHIETSLSNFCLPLFSAAILSFSISSSSVPPSSFLSTSVSSRPHLPFSFSLYLSLPPFHSFFNLYSSAPSYSILILSTYSSIIYLPPSSLPLFSYLLTASSIFTLNEVLGPPNVCLVAPLKARVVDVSALSRRRDYYLTCLCCRHPP